MSDFNFRFTNNKKTSAQPNAAREATSVTIPFVDETHLENSGGVTDKCFFLKNKITGEIFPWNDAMASDGRSFYLPHYDIKLLDTEEYKDYREVLVNTGRIQQVELSNLLSPAANKSVGAAIAKQIESGDVSAESLKMEQLPELQRGGDFMAEAVSVVVEAAAEKRRGRPPVAKP
jgi:hypothetical protein